MAPGILYIIYVYIWKKHAKQHRTEKRFFFFYFSSQVTRHYVNTEIIGLAAIQTVPSVFPNLTFFRTYKQKEVLKIYDRLQAVVFFFYFANELVHR